MQLKSLCLTSVSEKDVRPVTTLFLLMSVDGKISTGSTDELDVDSDFPKIAGVREGLHQYYEIEQTTDLWSFTSGKIQAKIGANTAGVLERLPVSSVVVDNSNLNSHGVQHLCMRTKKLVLVTTNPNHPALRLSAENLHIILQKRLSLEDVLLQLKFKYGCDAITIQTGGTLNGQFLREKLLDYIDIVVAPVLIGGANTPTLIDGASLLSCSELSNLGILKLLHCDVLSDSYIRLRYKVSYL